MKNYTKEELLRPLKPAGLKDDPDDRQISWQFYGNFFEKAITRSHLDKLQSKVKGDTMNNLKSIAKVGVSINEIVFFPLNEEFYELSHELNRAERYSKMKHFLPKKLYLY
jgi:hypothetical protein